MVKPDEGIIHLEFINPARDAIHEITGQWPVRFARVMDHAGSVHLRFLRKHTPVGKGGNPNARPGALKRGWRKTRAGRGEEAEIDITNIEPHIEWVTEGRPAIDNRPRGYPLHFWINGEELYRWSVKKAKPNPFHERAFEEASDQLESELPGIIEAELLG